MILFKSTTVLHYYAIISEKISKILTNCRNMIFLNFCLASAFLSRNLPICMPQKSKRKRILNNKLFIAVILLLYIYTYIYIYLKKKKNTNNHEKNRMLKYIELSILANLNVHSFPQKK